MTQVVLLIVLAGGACLPFGVATNNDAYCFRSHEPDTSCGVPAKVRWYYNQYTGVCTTYRTCSPPNKVYVNDFSSRERCERTCVQREVDCSTPPSVAHGSILRRGNVAFFTCEMGYTMIGSPHRVCFTNGSWSSSQTKCYKIIIFHENKEIDSTVTFGLGKTGIHIDCKMDPKLDQNGTAYWSFSKGGKMAALPWGTSFYRTDSNTTLRLRIDILHHTQIGQYTCTLDQLKKTILVQAELRIQKPLPLQQPPDRYPHPLNILQCGSILELSCTFRGSPNMTVLWMKNGSIISSLGNMATAQTTHFLGKGDQLVYSTLRVTRLSLEHRGSYRCRVANPGGVTVSRAATISVPCGAQVDRVSNHYATCKSVDYVFRGQIVSIQQNITEVQVLEVLKAFTVFTQTVVNVEVKRDPCQCQFLEVEQNYYIFANRTLNEDVPLRTLYSKSTFIVAVNTTTTEQLCRNI